MDNVTLANHIFELAELSKAAGENAFKSRAYVKAARAIKEYEENVSDLPDPTVIDGVGKGVAKKIKQFLETGTSEKAESLRKEVKYTELMKVPGIGPATAKALFKEQGIASVDDLKKAVKKGEVADSKILTGLRTLELVGTDRKRLDQALGVAEPVVQELKGKFPKAKVEIAGSLRRMKEDIGDIDIVFAGTEKQKAGAPEHFKKMLHSLLAEGKAKISGAIHGIQIQVRFFDLKHFGAAMLYFTGSKDFNVCMRNIAIRKNMTLNEYELKKGKKHIAGETELSVFEALGLVFVPPAMRETTYYLEKPEQVSKVVSKLNGDFHVHSVYSDGNGTIKQIAEKAKSLGLGYVGISDHSEKMAFTGGLDAKKSKQQVLEIDKLNRVSNGKPTILASREVEIDGKGNLDLPDNWQDLDYVVAALHYRRRDNTRAILKALKHPKVKILAHPTARLIGERPPMEADWEKIFRACAEHGVALEINANPQRLDLSPDLVKQARRLGCKFAISTDAHPLQSMEDLKFGLAIAQKAGLTPDDLFDPKRDLHP